ncbi:MAG: type II secretion system major pseudopilin GspG [Phycisphaerales bacterium]|nr:type II secretion system major pseudopilin GspG [Phycisphaerales bacterium]MCB9855877.1 type II secretion system major pseudopilin GspG [Phycisphaerales bacterium]
MVSHAFIRRNPRSRKGFTLLEILLVVGLLALLAAFAIPALISQSENAKKDMARAAIGPNGSITQAIDLYKFNTGQYPEELKDLMEKPSDDEIAEKWTGPYLNDAQGLVDPWTHPFVYRFPGDHNEGKFDLYSLGPNGIDGDEDDINNWKDK